MMLIRELRKEDYEEYILLINEFRPIDMYITREKFEEIYDIICKNSIIFVGILDNQIICSAKLIIEQKFIHKLAKYGHIEDVIVNKFKQKQGFGDELIKYIVEYCKNEDFYKIRLMCSGDLVKFYKKNNFIINEINMSQLLK
jgi:glucosamine-phosphate N-acetyltransferase